MSEDSAGIEDGGQAKRRDREEVLQSAGRLRGREGEGGG